jgi:hypothetical protein
MELLLGHLVGDYLTQWDRMANMKKHNSAIGFFYCLLHCLLYTISVHLFMGKWDLFPAIFASHFFVDRYYWLSKLHINIYKRPSVCSGSALGTFVYIGLDNTVHLVLMYLIFKYL